MAYKTDISYFRLPETAVKSGDEITFYLKIPRRAAFSPRLIINDEEFPLHWCGFENGLDIFSVQLTLDIGLYFYKFESASYVSPEEQITVYDKDFSTPEWMHGSIIYHIMVDRFNASGMTPVRPDVYFHENKDDIPFFLPDENGIVRNTDFYGGNLKGIEEKLPYFKSLGVGVLYLSPVFKASSNHKYDTGNYLEIDPMFGTKEDFESLCKNAAANGIHIILDGVFSHTGDDSLYFNKYGNYSSLGAYQSPESPYRNWYTFYDNGEYNCWWGITTLPTVNKENSEYTDFICSVMDYWQNAGVSGWRLDVADELPDRLLEKIKETAGKGRIIIGEVWEDASNKISYGKRRKYLLGHQLDSVTNYPLRTAIIDFVKYGSSGVLSDCIETILRNYPKPVIHCLMNILGTHDTERIMSVLGCDKIFSSKEEMAMFSLSEDERALAEKRLKIASVLQFFLPGVPTIYYGDEIGMEGLRDPFNRRFFAWENMSDSILSHYTKLSELRKENDVFKCGEYKTEFADGGVFIFSRFNKTEKIYVAVNANSTPHLLFDRIYDMLSNRYTDTLNPYGFVIYKSAKEEDNEY